MSLLSRLAEEFPNSPPAARMKAAVLYAGVRYNERFAEAADWAFPSYMPHHLLPGEPSFRGQRQFHVPYLAWFDGDTHVRLRIKRDSPFEILPTDDPRRFVLYEEDRPVAPLTFEPRLPWVDFLTGDGTPMRSTGLTQHGDMLVLNVAPGCEYFVAPTEQRDKTANLSCQFCLYGLPDKQRLEPLGQQIGVTALPEGTLDRVTEACCHSETHARHLYLVGGSMLDMAEEGERFVQIARRLNRAGLHERYYIGCGSGAIPREHMRQLKDLGVRGACFNLEVWDKAQFERVCPGKAKYVGRDRWLRSLEEAAEVFGHNEVMSAFVGGVELDGEGAFTSPEQSLASHQEAAEYLIPRGIQPVFSLFWKVTGKNRGEEPLYALETFLRLNEMLADVRRRHATPINPHFFCKHCAYMELEPDYDVPVIGNPETVRTVD
jgi:hypothetical protein